MPMEILIVILNVASWGIALPSNNDAALEITNTTNPNKDMYVIHAMVYQVGIITNRSDDIAGNVTGDQEALTLFHTNGSNIDLSGLPAPLLTNVTAQRMVGVAPALPSNSTYGAASLPWDRLARLTSLTSVNDTGIKKQVPQLRATRAAGNIRTKDNYNFYPYARPFLKRSTNVSEVDNDAADKTTIKITKGAAVIPQEAGVQSLAIPSLLTLNNNFTEIPVPIPNTSIVHYAKVNTLIHEAY